MRLIKLIFSCVIGYVLYELYLGMKEGSSGSRTGRAAGRRNLSRALNEDEGRTQNFTGAGRGTTVSTGNADGATMKHVVGRGVVPN